MTPRPVAFVLPSFAGGGAERVMITLANALDRGTFRATIVVFDASGPLADAVDPAISVLDLARPQLRRAIWPLRQTLRRLAPACIVSTMAYVNFGVLLAARTLPRRTRVIVREANMPTATLEAGPWPPLMRGLYRVCYPKAHKVVCPTRAIAEALERDFGASPDRLVVLPNPVDSARIRTAACTPRRRPGQGRRFVAAGRLTRQKGFDRLIEAMAGLDEDDHVTILGAGPEETALKRRVAELGLEARVTFAGFVAEPWPWFAGADAFLLPSRWEGMPNAALEALACGTPVIATPEAGGIAEVAALARPDAVTLAEAGEPLASAMAGVAPVVLDEPRPSLLPAAFDLAAVVDRWQTLLGAGVPSLSAC